MFLNKLTDLSVHLFLNTLQGKRLVSLLFKGPLDSAQEKPHLKESFAISPTRPGGPRALTPPYLNVGAPSRATVRSTAPRGTLRTKDLPGPAASQSWGQKGSAIWTGVAGAELGHQLGICPQACVHACVWAHAHTYAHACMQMCCKDLRSLCSFFSCPSFSRCDPRKLSAAVSLFSAASYASSRP